MSVFKVAECKKQPASVLIKNAISSLQFEIKLPRFDSNFRDHFVYAPSQWETTIHCMVVSRWLGPYPKWSLHSGRYFTDETFKCIFWKIFSFQFHWSLCLGVRWTTRYYWYRVIMIWRRTFHEVSMAVHLSTETLKWKCHFGEIFITGCTGNCRFDNF